MGMLGSKEKPLYYKAEAYTAHWQRTATMIFIIICDEGWRTSIVCGGMYEWAADWLVEQLQGKPYAKPKKEIS